MRNYYPIPKPIDLTVPYTVQVSLIGGTGFAEHFPNYTDALAYYEGPSCRGENISHVGLRPTLSHEMP